MYNLGIFSVIAAVWVYYLMGLPFVGIRISVGITIVLLGIKVYDDRYMGITAYGDRKDRLVISEDHLEIRNVKIPFSDLTNLVIYVDEYLGMPRELFGIHHGGNNKIEFNHNGRTVSINYVIKNKQDYDRVSRLVDAIEKNPHFKNNLRKLD